VRIAVALLVACGAPCPPADLAPLDREPAFAFVASDYASSAIGLLDRDGEVITEAWLDSGTTTPRIVATLSGDVVLASSPIAPCTLTVIDRFGTNVLTFLDACADEPLLGQLDVGLNPQDVIALDDRRALVSRHDPSFEEADGSDLIEIDWRAPRILSRVDLSALDRGEAYARPQRMVRLGDHVVVGLARLSADFMVAGPGAVAIVDSTTLEVTELAIPDLANCSEVDAMSEDRVIVTCLGPSFVREDERRAGAGVVFLERSADGIEITGTWRAADHPGAPVFNTGSVPISSECAVTTAMGDERDDIHDRVGVICVEGDVPVLFEADDAFVIGDGAFDDGAHVLLLPDADHTTIRRFAMDEREELDAIDVRGCRGLPPREVRPLLRHP
jgi:hypothetical protein